MAFWAAFVLSPIASPAASPDGTIPFDSRWDFANYISWRPANVRPVSLNPPRFSWPASPVIPPFASHRAKDGLVFPRYEYVFQLSQNPEFVAGRETIEKRTTINFENAFPILAEGTWYWRVGYSRPDAAPEQWSAIRTFTITPGTLSIDRTPIARAAADLAALPRPRLAPPDNDWAALRKRLEADSFTAPIIKHLLSSAEGILTKDWWKNFPANDAGDGATDRSVRSKLSVKFRDISRDLAVAALAHKFTGDARFQPVYDMALRVAKFPPGGETSPEFHGATQKWGTQWIPHLATIYDLGWHEYTPEQRAQFREGLRWRMDAVFNKGKSWRDSAGNPLVGGLAGSSESHPEENTHLATIGVLLMAGELPLADELTPVVLNYLLGVGSVYGPDGGWNEAGAYVIYKAKMALDAALIADKLLPGLRVAEYPWFHDLRDFVIQLTPPGMRRQGFGHYTSDMASPDRLGNLAYFLQRVVALDGSPSARQSLKGLAETGFDTAVYDRIVPLIAGYASTAPRPAYPASDATLPAAQILEEPGWFFAANFSPSAWSHAKDAVRLVSMARPRGGYSQSYSHDGAFVWQAFGTTLSAGGGIVSNKDPYSESGFSHNGILVDGHGASFRNPLSENPVSARPLFWKHDPAAGLTQWAADITGAFLVSPEGEVKNSNAPHLKDLPADRGALGLQRWIRHYALVNGRDTIIVDDLAMRADAAPARFTWLHHVPAVVPVEHDDAGGLRARYTIDGVEAAVRQFSSVPVEVKHLRGSDTLINPITGTDYGPSSKRVSKQAGHELTPADISGEVVVATTEPVRKARFITVLTARPKNESTPAEVVITPEAVTITRDGKTTRLALDAPEESSDINIPMTALRHFAETTDPYRLPPTGTLEKLALPTAESTEVEWLRRDNFSDAAWVNRWWVETENALVHALPGQGLEIRNNPRDPENTGGTTVWLRADAPERLVIRLRTTAQDNTIRQGIILRARQANDAPLALGTRTGSDASLNQEQNYSISLANDGSRITRNPGSAPVATAEISAALGPSRELVYAFEEGRLRCWINGQLVHDWTDTKPLPNGKLGLHISGGNLQIHDIEVGRIPTAKNL